MTLKTKELNSVVSYIEKETKTWERERKDPVADFCHF